jgi:NADPH-dependent curcumin reductase CurA
MTLISREVHLRSRPVGMPTLDNFELASVTVGEPGAGEVQVRNLWMTVDPAMRRWMDDVDVRSYAPRYQIGEVMSGGAIGEVVRSNDAAFQVGDLVMSELGWREAFTAPASALRKLNTLGLPPQMFLGVAGLTGFTAYLGLTKIAGLKPGDVVFVSGAAGAVGSVVCQIAKLMGHTVIGSAGGADKVAFLKEIGVDHVIDYKAVPDLTEALMAAAPDGIDVYYDNVGGEHLEAALAAARTFGRFAMCGAIAGYNLADGGAGIRGMRQVVGKQLRLQGFVVFSHLALMPEYLSQMVKWVESGQLKSRDTVEHGIENAPAAFLKLFTGGNLGKMLVKLD